MKLFSKAILGLIVLLGASLMIQCALAGTIDCKSLPFSKQSTTWHGSLKTLPPFTDGNATLDLYNYGGGQFILGSASSAQFASEFTQDQEVCTQQGDTTTIIINILTAFGDTAQLNLTYHNTAQDQDLLQVTGGNINESFPWGTDKYTIQPGILKKA